MTLFQAIILSLCFLLIQLLIMKSPNISFNTFRVWWYAIAEDLYNERKEKIKEKDTYYKDFEKEHSQGWYEDEKGVKHTTASDQFEIWGVHYVNNEWIITGCIGKEPKNIYNTTYWSPAMKQIEIKYSGKILWRYIKCFSGVLGAGGIFGIIAFIRTFI
jgi:hypothetical protein